MADPVESQGIAVALTRRGEAAGHVAETMVSAWQGMDVALSPIIGQRGLAMLYKRSLHITGRAHPWLKGMDEGSQASMDLAALEAVFAQQGSPEAAAAGGVLLQTFHELLSSLIGASLTERLLRPVWDTFSSGPPAQDSMP
jgi:hypothetical protein